MFTYDSKSGQMIYESPTLSPRPVSSAFKGKKIVRMLDKNDTVDTIVVEVNDHNKGCYEFAICATQITDIDKLCDVFVNHKITVDHYMKHALSTYMMNEYRRLITLNLIEYRHSTLGWYNYQGKNIFLGKSANINGLQSYYDKADDFRFQNGNYQAYMQFLNDTVFKSQNLSIALSIGYASIVHALLMDELDLETIVLNLCGASSTGKTTVEKLLVSPFTHPRTSNVGGLMRTFNSTTNALFASISGLNGLPIVLDDITTNDNINVSNLLYTLASSQGKNRCNADGSLKQNSYNWKGIVVISSETPIHEMQNQNQGLKARVLHTDGIVWTDSGEQANLIKTTVNKNYGFTGYEFADYVSKLNINNLIDMYYDSLERVNGFMAKKDNLSERLASKYAVFYMTFQLMNNFFSISLDCDSLMKILLQPEQNDVENRDVAKKGFDIICDKILTKRKNFTTINLLAGQSTVTHSVADNYGTIKQVGRSCEVYIPTSLVDEWLKANGINETATVKKRWKERSITKCDKDRNDTKCTTLKRRCICFVFPEGIQYDTDTPRALTTTSVSTPLTPPTIENLYKDEDIDSVFGGNYE